MKKTIPFIAILLLISLGYGCTSEELIENNKQPSEEKINTTTDSLTEKKPESTDNTKDNNIIFSDSNTNENQVIENNQPQVNGTNSNIEHNSNNNNLIIYDKPQSETLNKEETKEPEKEEIIIINKPTTYNEIPKTLDDSLNWKSGEFNNDSTFKENNNSIRLESYYTIEQTNYEFTMTNKNIRLIIKEYDSILNYLKSTDLGHKDIYTPTSNAKYIVISLYEYNDGFITSTYETLNNVLETITISTINDLTTILNNNAQLASYIHKGTLSNYSNYRKGYYKSWGGSFEANNGSLSTRNKYKVNPNKTYHININDSRVRVSIQEYKADGTWNKYREIHSNGDTYTPSPGTEYIALNLSTTIWGVNLQTLLNIGLTIDFADSFYIEETPTIDINLFDFNNYSNWKSGSYSNKGGFAISDTSLATTHYLSVANDKSTRMINLSDKYLRLNIIEIDSSNNVVTTKSLQSGEKWTPSETTSYIGVYISNGTKYTTNNYYEIFKNNHNISMNKYVKYNHNTIISPLTAHEFINIMNVGWNLGNSFDSYYGERNTETGSLGQEKTWGNPVVDKDLIDYVKKCGFNTIRIPVTWYYNTYEDENGNLKVREEWLKRISEVVDYAIENDLYVIINSHHDQKMIYTGVSEEEMQKVYKDAENLWKCIAEYFKTYDEHLIFESYNEVDNLEQSWSYSDKAANQMNILNQIFVTTVRNSGGNNTQRLLMIPTLIDGSSSEFFNGFKLPTDIVNDRLIIQVHNYSSQFDQGIEYLFESLEYYSKKLNTPIVIGEFGSTTSYSPAAYRIKHISNYVARAKNHGIKCIYWDNGSNYAIINRRNYAESNTEMINALINSKAYETSNTMILNDMSYFVWKTLNQKTGEIKDDIYWGTIITTVTDKGIPIPDNKNMINITLKTTGDGVRCRVHYIHFYDENGKLIKATNSHNGSLNYTLEIPAGSKYVRIGINNSYKATSEEKYTNYFKNNEMILTVGFLNLNDTNSLTEVK